MALQWDIDRMGTGQPIIDAQHKEWIQRVNQFETAILTGKGADSVKETLDFLSHYSDVHFKTEEETMARLNTPVLPENQLAHMEFRAKMAEISKWVKEAGPSSVEVIGLQMELEKWMENHICTIDVKLRDSVT